MRSRARQAAVLLVGAVLFAVAYALPAAAILVIWPVLFFVPGWALVSWARLPILRAEAIGLAVVLSVAVSAHVTYWVSVIGGGYDRVSVVVSAAILVVPAVLWSLAPGRPLAVRLVWRRDRAALLVAAIPTAFVAGFLAASMWVVDESGLTTSAVLWSDLLVHLSIATSVNAGNFPPEVPFYAGAPLTYHWFSDFHAAVAAIAADVFPTVAFIVGSTLLTGALALIVYGLARRLTGSRRAAVLAVVLVTLGGGMGYLRLFGDWATLGTNPLELLTSHSYDNRWNTDWPYFRIPSVMGTGLLSHRATTAGLPMLAGSVLLLAVSLRRRRTPTPHRRDHPRGLLLAGALAALSAPFHFFFFPAILLVALLHVASAGRLTDRRAARNAAAFLAPMMLALPFVATPLLLSAGEGRLRPQLWWEAPVAEGPGGVAFFYLTNLGVPAILGVVALLVRRPPGARLLAVWAIPMFLIPNVAVFTYVTFDMNKYFQAMWIPIAIAAAWLIRGWPRPAIAAVLLLSLASPVQIGIYGLAERYGVLQAEDLVAARWAEASTPPRSVFVTDGWLHSFTDLAGRLRVLSFTPYIANLGHDPSDREQDVRDIYCGGDAGRSVELVASLGARYVVDSGPPSGCDAPVSFAGGAFELAFEHGSLRVWQLPSSSGR